MSEAMRSLDAVSTKYWILFRNKLAYGIIVYILDNRSLTT